MEEQEALAQEPAEQTGEERTPRYRLPVFEGPLDLLLYLIQKNEIDIYDIPVALITEQYNEYLDRMRALDLDVAADFILMAATLIQIKSRMLLPASPLTADGAPAEDPRQPLVDQLLAYQRLKEISHFLQEREEVSSAQYPRSPVPSSELWDPAQAGLDVDLYDLLDALQRILKRAADRRERLVYAPELSLVTCMNKVLDLLGNHGSVLFGELFSESTSKMEIVVTFLALLELVKQKVVLLFQEEPLGPIRAVLVT
jgi:segregation and condensation protein A